MQGTVGVAGRSRMLNSGSAKCVRRCSASGALATHPMWSAPIVDIRRLEVNSLALSVRRWWSWYRPRMVLARWIDHRYPQACWSQLVMWADGYTSTWDMFFRGTGESGLWAQQSCTAETPDGNEGASCGKCERNGRLPHGYWWRTHIESWRG